MSANIHISLSAEPIAHIGTFPITNSMLTSALVSVLIVGFAVAANRSLKATSKPKGMQNVAEFIVESMFNFCNMITGDMKRSQVFLPWIASFFIFIILNNWSGLVPGVGYIFVPVSKPITHTESAQQHETSSVISQAQASEAIEQPEEANTAEMALTEHAAVVQDEAGDAMAGEIEVVEGHSAVKMAPLFRAGTADLNTTLALGFVSVFMIQYFGFAFQGFHYTSKYINFSSPINFFVGILELISEFGKIISFGFRLFGNVFAGEVLIAVLMYLTKVIIPVPFYGLEVFVGMMQAVVFSMLSLVLYNMATIGHGEEH